MRVLTPAPSAITFVEVTVSCSTALGSAVISVKADSVLCTAAFAVTVYDDGMYDTAVIKVMTAKNTTLKDLLIKINKSIVRQSIHTMTFLCHKHQPR